jgi:hypothetical protein
VLGFLYRKLCEACRCNAETSTQAGCTHLLQLWMWSRLPVGSPHVLEPNPWDDHGNPNLARTVAYLWDVVSPRMRLTTERTLITRTRSTPSSPPWFVNMNCSNSDHLLLQIHDFNIIIHLVTNNDRWSGSLTTQRQS